MDEPRWPRGTPIAPSGRGPGGGRFRGGPGMSAPAGWAERLAAAAAARTESVGHALMSHDEVKSYLGRQDYQVVGQARGEQGRVEFRQYGDGRKMAYKYVTRSVTREDGSVLVPWEHAVHAEEQTSILGHAIGAPVPAVVRDPQDRHGLLMQYIEGDPNGSGPNETLLASLGARDTPGGHMLGLLDLLSGNGDRHRFNVIIPDEQTKEPVGIDHGTAMITQRWGGPLDDVHTRHLASQFAIPYVVDAMGERQHYYSRDAIREARRRIEKVADQLDGPVLAGVRSVLDELEATSPINGHDLGE